MYIEKKVLEKKKSCEEINVLEEIFFEKWKALKCFLKRETFLKSSCFWRKMWEFLFLKIQVFTQERVLKELFKKVFFKVGENGFFKH